MMTLLFVVNLNIFTKKMKKYEKSRVKRAVKITPEELAGFINEEIDILSNEIKCS